MAQDAGDRDPDPRTFDARGAERLDWLLDPRERAKRRRAELESSAEDARELAELERFLAHCRGAARELDVVPSSRRRALHERIYAATTREDLSWRGDLRLLGGFVAARLRSSRALRIAAASLLLHLLALPVLAWYGWTHFGPDGPTLRFEPEPAKEPFAEQEEVAPAIAPDALDPLNLPLGEGDGVLYVANSRGWARFEIRAGVPSLPPVMGDEGRVARLLRARVDALAPEREPEIPSELAPAADASLVERALWCELLLDVHLREPLSPPELESALLQLASTPLPDGDAGLLAASALARAESYGALPRGAVEALWAARARFAGAQGAELIAPGGDLRRVAPVDARWVELLARAAGDALPAPLADALGTR